jgi:hypothetical protein
VARLIPRHEAALVAAYPFDARKQRLAVKDIKGLLAVAIGASKRSDDKRIEALVDELSLALDEAKKKRIEMATGIVDAAFSAFLPDDGGRHG